MKKKGTWKLVLGVIMVLGAFSMFGDGSGDGFIAIIIGAALLAWWYLPRKSAADETAKVQAEQAARTYKFKVVGVTFDNDDGSSRQEALKAVYENGKTAPATFQKYVYEGEPAMYVFANGNCVGNVAAGQSTNVAALISNGRAGTLCVDKFKGEDGETIYYASLKF